MGIINRLGVFKKKTITHIINDGETEHEFRFYPPRFKNIANGRTRNLLEPIVQAVTTILAGNADLKTQHTVYGEGGVPIESSTMAQEPDVIKAVELRKRNAISDALGVLLNEDTAKHLGVLLADSLRDDFPAPDHQDFDGVVEQFMEEVTTDVFIQLMMGYFKSILPFLDSSGKSTHSSLLERARQLLGQAGVEGIVNEEAAKAAEILQGPTPSEKQNSTEVSTSPSSS